MRAIRPDVDIIFSGGERVSVLKHDLVTLKCRTCSS